ncbi:hypothetical protein CRG98_039687 [Punica granatum]|uniref:Uncharacterized protein n=1 Tax=Punica granatum TaxID=22663 RepID=A0A2I0I7H0_PUNGR|nr:hypothetical protein CRG98_039687 [Punica granatum]
MLDLLTCASLLFGFASSPSLLARASCNLAWSAHLCEFTFRLRKFTEPARSCILQPCRVCSPVRVYFSDSVCSPVRVYFSASQVRRACSLVPHTILPGLLTRASLLLYFASSPSLLACGSYNLSGSAHPCEFSFLLRKYADPARSWILQPCWVCSPVRVYFSDLEVRRACSLVPHTIFPGLLTPASFLFCFASTPILLARGSCNLAGSAHPCEFTSLIWKFAEPARWCLIQSFRVCSPVRVYFSDSEVRRACSLFAEPARWCLIQSFRVCSPVRVYFSDSEVRRACSLVPHTIFPGLLTRASLLFCFAVYFSTSQVRRVCSLVPLATLPGLLTCASLLFGFASSPSLLAPAYCNLAGSAHLCEFTFLLRKYADPARSCILQPCRVCSPVRVYYSDSEVHRACSLVPHTIFPGLLTPASFLFFFASTPILLARASCNLAGSAHPCEFTTLIRKFTEPARWCLIQSFRVCSPLRVFFSSSQYADPARSCILQPCRVCSPVRVYYSDSEVHRACSLVPHTIFPGLLTPASFLFFFASTPILLARASCNLAGSAHPCEFTTLIRKFTEPARCSPSLLAGASYNLSGSAHPCEFSFLLRKYADPARSCILQPCRVCSPVRVYYSDSEVHRACSLVPHTIFPGLLTPASFLFFFASTPILLARASCNLAGSAHPCEFTFLLRKYADPARSCILQPCRVCSPVRVYFYTSQVHRACSFVPHTIFPGLLTPASFLFFFASTPILLARASCNLAGSAHPCEFTFLLRKFAEPARLCLIQSCRVCSPVRVYFSASQVRRACSLVPHTILPGLLTRASLLLYFASSPGLLACASNNLAGSAHPWKFTFLLREYADPARSCILQPCRVCSPVRV